MSKVESKYSNKVLEIIKYFQDTQYNVHIDDVIRTYVHGDMNEFNKCVAKFPTDFQLLENLVLKLKGKSVYTNLNKILKNENVVKEDQAIALSSLLTHCLIEIKTNKEYKMLLSDLYKRLGGLL